MLDKDGIERIGTFCEVNEKVSFIYVGTENNFRLAPPLQEEFIYATAGRSVRVPDDLAQKAALARNLRSAMFLSTLVRSKINGLANTTFPQNFVLVR